MVDEQGEWSTFLLSMDSLAGTGSILVAGGQFDSDVQLLTECCNDINGLYETKVWDGQKFRLDESNTFPVYWMIGCFEVFQSSSMARFNHFEVDHAHCLLFRRMAFTTC